jgi:hypothetical protein
MRYEPGLLCIAVFDFIPTPPADLQKNRGLRMSWWSKLKKWVKGAVKAVTSYVKDLWTDRLSEAFEWFTHHLLVTALIITQALTGIPVYVVYMVWRIRDYTVSGLNVIKQAFLHHKLSVGTVIGVAMALAVIYASFQSGINLPYPQGAIQPVEVPHHTSTVKPSAVPTENPSAAPTPTPPSGTPTPTPPSGTPTPAPTKADTTTTVQLSTYNVSRGFTMTVTAFVTSARGTGTPSGMVTYLIDGNQVGQAPVNSGIGITAATTMGLSVGTHTMTALYNGDSTFNPSQVTASFDVNNGV